MLVREIMTADPTCCTPETSLQTAARMMVDADCGAIPVIVDEDSQIPRGIITDRDIVCRAVAEGSNPFELKVSDCMSEGVATVPDDMSIEECCGMMERAQVRRVPVVDARGRLCGIVAQADIARRVPQETLAAELVEHVSAPSKHASTLR
jgi:CBS domain-containing protein